MTAQCETCRWKEDPCYEKDFDSGLVEGKVVVRECRSYEPEPSDPTTIIVRSPT